MTVDAKLPKRSLDLARVAKPFNPDTVCQTSVNDVLSPQPFQDSITTAPVCDPTDFTGGESQKGQKERQGKGLKKSVFPSFSVQRGSVLGWSFDSTTR